MSPIAIPVSSSDSVLSWSSNLCWAVECSQPAVYSTTKLVMPEELAQAKLGLSALLSEVVHRDPAHPTFRGNPACSPEEVARVILERERSALTTGLPAAEEQWQVRWAVLVLYEKHLLEKRSSRSENSERASCTPSEDEIYRALDVRPDDIEWLVARNVPTEKIIDLFRAFVSAKLNFENAPEAPEFIRRLYENPRVAI